MKKTLLPFLFLLGFTFAFAQSTQPPYTPTSERIQSFEQRKALETQSIVNTIEFRSVGPTVFSGRVDDVEVYEKDPSHFYVAYASGGLWKTENNGTSFTPIFDQEAVMSIGDIAVDWDKNTIWVGTGEVNSSRSSYSGTGMYKSTDDGKTWQHMGLGESHHIGRIILHPDNPDVLWVAALGHLYSPNPERGVFKTTNGGKTWEKTLFVHENAGAVDMVIDPADPNILYAAIWDRQRRAWNLVESGAGSGIYKSEDGGENWKLLTTPKSGFPTGEGAGRIGLAITKKEGKTLLYSIIDNCNRRPKEKKEKEGLLTKEELRTMSAEEFLQLEKKKIKTYLEENGFPEKYGLEKVIEMIKAEKITPLALVEYTEDANSLLFDTPVIGAEVYVSDNEGKKWKKTHDDFLDGLYYSYGYYFGQIRVSPHNPNKIYIFGVPILKSEDVGKTFESIGGDNVHGDHHALWLNPNRDGHLILGNDGGANISYDDGKKWIKCNAPPLGQFYGIAVDMAKPYNVYGGLQDNGVWKGPSNYTAGTRWHSSGHYPYDFVLGGDGMQVAVDTRDNVTVYTGFQFGNYFRVNTKTGKRNFITPKHELGERPLRWNWQTPIHLSAHNQDILYMGSNKLHRSMDQAKSFHAISDDLTTGGKKGDVAYSTLTSIHESPLKFGLIYVGSDDGLVHVTRDGGNSWNLINDNLPKDMWVSRIQASQHEEGTVFISLNGYRWDDFASYVYKSTDFGENWQHIGLDLPLEPVNVIKEDPENKNLLYVGTDHGLYVSLDQGSSFMLMNNGLPAAPVHDVVIHPREKELVVGTHGRSIYIGNVKELQQLDEKLLAKNLHIFPIKAVRYSSRWGNRSNQWREPNVPEIQITEHKKTEGKTKFTVKTSENLVLKSWEADSSQGLNYFLYDLSIEKKTLNEYENFIKKDLKEGDDPVKLKKGDNGQYYLYKGKYVLELEKEGEKVEAEMEIKE